MAMETEMTTSGGQGWRIAGWGAAATLLAMPFVAMQFTDEVKWDGEDFLFAGILFATVGLLIELTVRRSQSWAVRAGAIAAVFAGFLIIWANGAVGMIGNEGNAYNLLFGLPILIALGGSIAARFRRRRHEPHDACRRRRPHGRGARRAGDGSTRRGVQPAAVVLLAGGRGPASRSGAGCQI